MIMPNYISKWENLSTMQFECITLYKVRNHEKLIVIALLFNLKALSPKPFLTYIKSSKLHKLKKIYMGVSIHTLTLTLKS